MDSNYCWNCGKLIPFSTGKRKRRYCNDSCRMAYKRKTEQSKANIKTEQSKAEAHTVQGIIVDACGTEHPIDYEGRCKDQATLDDWHENKGTPYQYTLSHLGWQYDIMYGYREQHTGKPTEQMRRYLGQTG